MDFLAIAGPATREVVRLTAEEAGGLTINVFWIIIGAANFILFFALFKMFFATPIAGMLADRRARIEQGLSDAEAARAERESSAAERTGDDHRGAPRGQGDHRPGPEGGPGDP